MNLKLKNTLIIVVTLVLGMLIGVLICGRFTKMKLEKIKNYYTERGFKRQFIKTVNPTPEQLKKLEPFLKENGRENKELIREFKKRRQELYQKFKKDISGILTPAQLQKLEQFEKRQMRIRNKKAQHLKKSKRFRKIKRK